MVKLLSTLFCVALSFTATAQRISPSLKVSEFGVAEPIVASTNTVWLAKPKKDRKPNIEKKVKDHGPKNKSKHLVHLNLVRLEIDNPELLEALREDVEYIEPDSPVSIAVSPTDPMWPQQWDMTNIFMPQAWDKSQGDSDIVVAVFDTGIDFTHPDLATHLYTGQNGNHGWTCINGNLVSDGMDNHGHGTHVSGTVGAVANNGIGISGMNWNVKLMAMKFLNKNGDGTIADVIELLDKSIELKAQGVDIRVGNHSWGGPGSEQVLRDAFQSVEQAGILSVIAAGNSGQDIGINPFQPAGLGNRGSVTVLASDSANKLAQFSNYNLVLTDVSAPGVSTLSTVPTNTTFIMGSANGYKTASGTSMSTPHVSGLSALVVALNPNLSVYELKDILLNSQSTDEMTEMGLLSTTGAKINAQKTLSNPLVFSPKTNSPPIVSDIKAYDTVGGNPTVVSFNASDPNGDALRVITVNGWNRIASLTNVFPFTPDNRFLDVSFPFFVGASDKNGGADGSNLFLNVYSDPDTFKIHDYKIGITATNPVGTSDLFVRVWLITNSIPSKEVYFKPYVTSAGLNAWNSNWLPIGNGFNVNYRGYLNTNASYMVKAYTYNDQFSPHADSDRIILRTGTDATNTTPFPVLNVKFNKLCGTTPFTLHFAVTNLANLKTNNNFWVMGSAGVCVNCNYANGSGSYFNGSLTFPEPGIHSLAIMVEDLEHGSAWDVREWKVSVTAPTNSPPIQPIPVLSAPTSLTVTKAGASMNLNWIDNATGEDRYEVEMSGKKTGPFPPFSKVATLPPSSHGYPQGGGVKNWNYQFRVRCAAGTNFSDYSNVASIRFK